MKTYNEFLTEVKVQTKLKKVKVSADRYSLTFGDVEVGTLTSSTLNKQKTWHYSGKTASGKQIFNSKYLRNTDAFIDFNHSYFND